MFVGLLGLKFLKPDGEPVKVHPAEAYQTKSAKVQIRLAVHCLVEKVISWKLPQFAT